MGVLFLSLVALANWRMFAQGDIPVSARVADEILIQGKGWELLGQGYQLTADSAVDGDGNVYCTDARKNRILKIDGAGKISVWKEGSNGAHGVAFGPDGRLYAGQHDRKRVVAYSRDGTETVMAEGVQSHHLTVTSRNHVYLTVPPARQVWLVVAQGQKRVVHEGLNWPRGVRASPDQSRLVVNDARTRWVWSFQIGRDGSLVDGRTFCRLEIRQGAADADAGGMVFDSKGFLFVATDLGVQVCGQGGQVAGIIEIPGGSASNVFFGGPGLMWLYVTDGDKIYRRPVQRRGTLAWRAEPG